MNARSKPARLDAAVALVYRPAMEAPLIAASLRGKAAERAREVARLAGVPVIHDPAATAVLVPLDVGQMVPPEYWELVARVFVVMAGLESRPA